MFNIVVIWLICSMVVFTALVLGRTSLLRRRLKIMDLDWKAVAVISILSGAIPAFLYDQASSRSVEIPETVEDRGAVPGSAAR